MNQDTVQEQLIAKFDTKVSNFEDSFGILAFNVPGDTNLEVATFLRDNLGFDFITDITAVHFPDRKNEELCVVTHLHNLRENVRIRMRNYIPISAPNVYSLVSIYLGANWMERETYDFFGVNFINHPELKRILNVDEMDYFPMLKQYQMEDPTRLDKDDEMFGR